MSYCVEHIKRKDDVATVVFGEGHYQHLIGKTYCVLTNTGNGYIAKFPAIGSIKQDHYVELDYSQAVSLINALSTFKKELGFV